MNTVSVRVPATVPIAVIEAALREFGATVVQARKREPKPEKVYEPVVYLKHVKHGPPELREIDGISADKAIRKMMSALNSQMMCDGRSKGMFERLGNTTADYVSNFCSRLHHVKAVYTTDSI